MQIKSIFFKLMLLILLVNTLACNNDDEQSAADLTFPVSVEKVKRGPIAAYISTTGTLKAIREERVLAEVEGILKIAKNNGTSPAAGLKVQAGDLLAEIENREHLLYVRVESNKMAMDNAARELEKQEALFKEGGVTEKELEIARRNALDARLNYESAVLRAGKLRLKAPISGYIANLRSASEGTRINAGFVLCTIMEYSTTLVTVNLPNTDLGRVQAGQKVIITNYALEGKTFEGVVMTIDPAIDERTRTFAVTIEVENPNLRLRPGMFVKADIVVESREDAIVIPKTSIVTRNNKPVVYVVEGASAQEREVRTGVETREEIEILEGIADNEQLVVQGQATLRDKSKVRVRK
jgi:RND family efflux transporter MFP subunit